MKDNKLTITWCQNGYIIESIKSHKVYVCVRDKGEILKASTLPEILEEIGEKEFKSLPNEEGK